MFEFFCVLVLAWIGSKLHDVVVEMRGIRSALERSIPKVPPAYDAD